MRQAIHLLDILMHFFVATEPLIVRKLMLLSILWQHEFYRLLNQPILQDFLRQQQIIFDELLHLDSFEPIPK
jgi:hypothetical protein